MRKRKRGTKTSSFGVKGREAHDSTPFYSRKLYGRWELPKPSPEDLVERSVPKELLDEVLLGDARDVLKKFPPNCMHLMVTSPPYNVGKEYDEDLTLSEYLDFLAEVMEQVHRVLVWGGRVCFNVANLGRKPYLPLHKYIMDVFEEIGFLMRGEVIWYKGDAVAGSSTAWGTWKSAVNPTLRDTHEYLLVFSKGTFKRRNVGRRESTISRDEFIEFTKSVWTFSPESATSVGHPAPFPIELPYRCIQLYTLKGDVVLDPFVGSGTTCLASAMTGRHYVGIDVDENYVKLAKKRINEYIAQKQLTEFR
ncbi:site-specific DNA-methyltransferase [Candidatus Bathyarchaeota archaeon]|nr:MAG: site-specific DNA-methyltransferase [Candidatus Bathyarchaeota archaeon]